MVTYDLILGSQSPRRIEFLKNLGFKFKVVAPNINEQILDGESADKLVLRLATAKCKAIQAQYPNEIVLSADTVVCIDDKILGKPKDAADAKAMLKLLSGRYHQVLTAVCVGKGSKVESFLCKTEVLFDTLSDEIIDEYIKTGESLDKSGSYAVQGIAAMFILEVKGSVSSVVGLPVAQTRKILEHFGLFYKYQG